MKCSIRLDGGTRGHHVPVVGGSRRLILSLLPFLAALAAAIALAAAAPRARAAIALSDSGTLWTATALANMNNFQISPTANVFVAEVDFRYSNNTTTWLAPTVTYNGVPMTLAVLQQSASLSVTTISTAAIYYLDANQAGWATGIADPLSVTINGTQSGGFTISDCGIDAFSLSGVNLAAMPGASQPGSTGAFDGGGVSSVSAGLSNIPAGSWAAFTSTYHQGGTSPLSASLSSGAGTLVNNGNGNQWGTVYGKSVMAGALVANVQSSSLTLTESASTAATNHWELVAAVFQPAVTPLIWTGSTNSSWSLAASDANWSGPASYYSDGRAVVFPDAVAQTNVAIVSGGVQPAGVTFTNNTANYVLSGGAISGSAAVTLSGSGLVTFDSTNSYTGTTTVSTGTLQLNSGSGTAVSGGLSVAGGAVQCLQNNQIASASNVSLTAGVLNIGPYGNTVGGVQLTGGMIAGSGGTLTSATAFNVQSGAAGANLAGAVGLNKTTTGTVALSGANTYSGVTAINGGTLNLANLLAVQNSTVNLSTSGGLAFATGITSPTLGGLSGDGNISLFDASSNAVTLQVGNNSQSTTYGGILSGAGGLAKIGSGTLTLTATHSYSGPTSIAAGTLQLMGGVGQTLQADTLMSTTLNAAYWTKNTTADYDGDQASVTPTANGVQLFQRGYLNTAAQFDPTAIPGGLNISGNWQMTNGPTASSGHQETMRIVTRSTGTGSGTYYQNTSGIEFVYAEGSADPSISTDGNFTIGAVTTTGNLDPTGASNYGDHLYFDVIDNGQGALSISMSDLTTGTTASATATLLSGAATSNLITFYNREQSNCTSLVNNVVIASGGYGSSNLLPAATAVTIAPGSTLDLDGTAQQVASLSDSGSLGGGSVINSSTAESVLMLAATGGLTSFSGVIAGGGTLGVISLTISGSGTQVLSGANTYTGGTLVEDGTLVLDSPSALADGSSLTVGEDASSIFAPAGPSPEAVAVPEPGTPLLLAAGAFFAFALRRRAVETAVGDRFHSIRANHLP
jgi:autotransporter-associated beta strand protein